MILFFSYQDGLELCGVASFFLFCVLLLSFPFSLALFYKFVLRFCIFSCSLGVFVSWVFYNLSEQFYFVKYVVSGYIPRMDLGVLKFI